MKYILIQSLRKNLVRKCMCYGCNVHSKGKEPDWSSRHFPEEVTGVNRKGVKVWESPWIHSSLLQEQTATSWSSLKSNPLTENKIPYESTRTEGTTTLVWGKQKDLKWLSVHPSTEHTHFFLSVFLSFLPTFLRCVSLCVCSLGAW